MKDSMLEATGVATAEPCCTPRGKVAAGEPCCEPGDVRQARIRDEREQEIKRGVREYYAERATTGSSCCGAGCGCGTGDELDAIGIAVGYSEEELRAAPEGANLGLGCGNPTAIDAIPEGATVLDLGSGAGMDSFLAAQRVGPSGRVIGVDMTPEMIARARENADRVGIDNVEFRLGEIEDLPIEDSTIDIIISNCVINLSPDKPRVFSEAFRVLRPGGRLMVSDLVLSGALPDYIRDSAAAYAGCVAGAELKYRYLAQIQDAGFTDIRVSGEDDYLSVLNADTTLEWIPESRRDEAAARPSESLPVISLKVSAVKAQAPFLSRDQLRRPG